MEFLIRKWRRTRTCEFEDTLLKYSNIWLLIRLLNELGLVVLNLVKK